MQAYRKDTVIDRYTADFIVERPIPSIPAKLACYTLMVSKNDRDGKDPKLYEKKPMGTGPYKLIEWKKGEHVMAVRNENYFLGVPKIKKINFYREFPASMSSLKFFSSVAIYLIFRYG